MTSRAYLNVPIGLAALAGLLLAAGPAAAQVQNEKLHVQARIGELCTVTSASLDFGQLANLDSPGTDFRSEGAIDIDCDGATTDIKVALDAGLQGSGNVRNMQGNGRTIQYILFKDANYSETWGAGQQVEEPIQGTGSVAVYGQVGPQTDSHPPGLYTDEVTITLSF